jgi:endonuclease YncB( thermonuclease family)
MLKLILHLCLSLHLSPDYVKRVIDGDTFILYSIGIPAEERIRVLNVNSPELRTSPLADSARIFTTNWLKAGDFDIYACKRDSFGRLLAIVSRNGKTLADTLIVLNLGVPYR